MVRRSKGLRSKSRKTLRKKPRERGIHSITRALQQFEEGDSV
ncbi:MAG: 50S ribosomal protein L21e, partial [Thermoplasmatales archaeon]|nr:50S ribosomal protein L21e [Thermoplasmatales archaeon]